MLELISVLFILLFVGVYFLTRDFFHPAVIVSGLWMLLLVLYATCDHPLYDLSNNFIIAISLWVFPFVLFSYSFSKVPLKVYAPPIDNHKGKMIFDRLYPYILLYSVLFIATILFYAGGLSFIAIRTLLLEPSFPPLLMLLFYLNSLLVIYALYGILNIDEFGHKKVTSVIVLLLIMSLFKSNKTSFLSLFVGLLFCLKRTGKLRFSHIIFLSIAFLLLIILLSLNRADYDFEADSGIINFLYIYLLSPLTAFDTLLNNEVHLSQGSIGSGTFVFFYKILNIFGADLKIADLGTYVYVPLPTNVYTTMRGFYLDFGYWGIFIFSSLLGGIWGGLYRLQRNGNKIFTLFYASMVSSLFFQSFGDYFFYSLSMTIQYYIFSVLIIRGLKWKL